MGPKAESQLVSMCMSNPCSPFEQVEHTGYYVLLDKTLSPTVNIWVQIGIAKCFAIEALVSCTYPARKECLVPSRRSMQEYWTESIKFT